MSKLKFRRKNLAIFYTVFLIVFVVAPLLLIFYYAFTNDAGQITFHRVVGFFSDSSSLNDLLVSILIGAANTLLCLLIGYPVAYLLANPKYNKSKMMLLLYVMPMWINFVLRTGATKDLLYWIGISGNNRPYAATLIGMVYNYLPFVILPLYATMQKMDQSQVEAARDLGANPVQTFIKLIIPMTMPGIVSAILMVFVPTMSSFVISNALGGAKVNLIGNNINTSFNYSRWGDGSFTAIIMLLLIGLTFLLTKNVNKEEGRGSLW
jgi:spermidine/putrescine transport system permease protein